MNKDKVLLSMFWSAIALIIPLLGNSFVDGWNWGFSDFIFAWVFFVIMSLSIRFVMSRVTNSNYRMVSGIVVFLFFAFIWIMLATG